MSKGWLRLRKFGFVLALSHLIAIGPALANSPKIGDFVRYYRTLKDSNGVRNLEFTREIKEWNADEGFFVVEWAVQENGAWRRWTEPMRMLEYSYGLYDDCAGHGGRYEPIPTPKGSLDACYRERRSSSHRYEDWHGRVPFGLIRNYYIDANVEFSTWLVDFR